MRHNENFERLAKFAEQQGRYNNGISFGALLRHRPDGILVLATTRSVRYLLGRYSPEEYSIAVEDAGFLFRALRRAGLSCFYFRSYAS